MQWDHVETIYDGSIKRFFNDEYKIGKLVKVLVFDYIIKNCSNLKSELRSEIITIFENLLCQN